MAFKCLQGTEFDGDGENTTPPPHEDQSGKAGSGSNEGVKIQFEGCPIGLPFPRCPDCSCPDGA